MKKTTRKLSLNIETVRRLTNRDLSVVVGGKPGGTGDTSEVTKVKPPAGEPPGYEPTC